MIVDYTKPIEAVRDNGTVTEAYYVGPNHDGQPVVQFVMTGGEWSSEWAVGQENHLVSDHCYTIRNVAFKHRFKVGDYIHGVNAENRAYKVISAADGVDEYALESPSGVKYVACVMSNWQPYPSGQTPPEFQPKMIPLDHESFLAATGWGNPGVTVLVRSNNKQSHWVAQAIYTQDCGIVYGSISTGAVHNWSDLQEHCTYSTSGPKGPWYRFERGAK